MTLPGIHSREDRIAHKRRVVQSFKARMDAKRTWMERVADALTRFFGTVSFLFVNLLFFFAWILWNSGSIAGLRVVDPYPFTFLIMMVSLEAIFLAVTVLISQNREARVTDLREEVELYVDTYAEDEITKIIYLLKLLLENAGIDTSKDKDLHEMLERLPSARIEEELEKQMQ